jgi:hypothetical protein
VTAHFVILPDGIDPHLGGDLRVRTEADPITRPSRAGSSSLAVGTARRWRGRARAARFFLVVVVLGAEGLADVSAPVFLAVASFAAFFFDAPSPLPTLPLTGEANACTGTNSRGYPGCFTPSTLDELGYRIANNSCSMIVWAGKIVHETP